MKVLRHNCKGMVTVFVSLLLIPSILVSGTAVDLARVYAARSVVQDANQLAANSVLASYDALLQDLYGLFGVMQSDQELADMVDQYVQVAVFGQENRNQGLGTFQLTYGSDLKPGTVQPAPGQNLDNLDVLRRQIEEYAKFRAPVILIDQLLERLKAFKKVKKDSEVIEKKMDIDDRMEDLEKIYQKIYDQIQVVNGCAAAEKNAITEINGILKEINEQLRTAFDVRDTYIKLTISDDTDTGSPEYQKKRDAFHTRYQGCLANVAALVAGGRIKSWWDPNKGEFQQQEQVEKSLEACLKEEKKAIEAYTGELDKLVRYCKEGDKKKGELSRKVDELENALNAEDGCSEDLRNGLTTPQAENGNRSAIEVYRNLLGYDIAPMGEAMRDHDAEQIDRVVKILDTFQYGDQKWGKIEDGTKIELADLKKMNDMPEYKIDWNQDNWKYTSSEKDPIGKIGLLGPSLTELVLPDKDPYELFQSAAFDRTRNRAFYEELQRICNGSGDDGKKKAAKQSISKIFKQAQEIFRGCLVYEPEGAWTYQPNTAGSGDSGDAGEVLESGFGSDGDWGEEGEAKKQAKKALHGDLIGRLGDLGDDVANRCLLLTYDTEMFSNYATKADGSEKNMAGIPLSTDVNYYFQSELEYLYAGNLYDAKSNLKTVSGMILLVRFVFNYIASFHIGEVNDLVSTVKRTLAPISGPFAFLMGELVRIAMAMGESALDVGRIRSGHKVVLYKKKDDWRFSIKGLANMAEGGLSDDFEVEAEESSLDDEGPTAMSYTDYLRIFLLFVSDNALAERTKNLIELNLTNKKNDIGSKGDHTAREAAMTAAPLEDLSKAATGFSITTTLDLRMLFLSMPVARQGVNGTIPPGVVPISVTDYRGY
ncbi:DUF5702 domain-containing protein [Clostridium sp. D33t1_170424_F3]|uniref:DUF5702 domain-containing protein n=1 Tax=Clostridium sp. D33t1_170424_F3 TaxID=2787099 RepID=UPI0018AA611D|nr:DUF5702 domain-containing protein [Clostridium sp. D33t1_170424_F3]